MKLLRFGAPGAEKPGILDSAGVLRDLSGVVRDLAGEVLTKRGIDTLRGIEIEALPVVTSENRLGPCVGQVGKVIGVGLNYRKHAAEAGMALPREPVLFSKAVSAISGPNDALILPPGAKKTDWEVELAVVMGSVAKEVPPERALDHVVGYATVNDLSDRGYQLEGTGQWLKGKSLDGFAPLGPWLATADEVVDPNALGIWLELNNTRVQDSTTADMLFAVEELVSYISQFMTLLPGDVIATGTPEGVGMGRKPPRYLRPGDTMRLGVEGLGIQEQTVYAAN